jgi:polyisoprenoid-binding protein YceI
VSRVPRIALLCLALAPAAAAAQAVDYARSRITCVSTQVKVPVEAEFRRFAAQLAFDPAQPEAGSAQIEIDLASFDIGSEEVNVEARGRNWFDVKSHPLARFVSSSARAIGGGRYEARGPLTIKGRTHDAAVPFTVKTDAAGNATFEGTFAVRRLLYGIGEGVWKDTDTVADEVQIRFRIVTSGKPQRKP